MDRNRLFRIAGITEEIDLEHHREVAQALDDISKAIAKAIDVTQTREQVSYKEAADQVKEDVRYMLQTF